MSKELDPDNLSEEDVEYVKQRPWIREEMILQGYGDPLEKEDPPENPLNVITSPSADSDPKDGEDDEDDDEDGGK